MKKRKGGKGNESQSRDKVEGEGGRGKEVEKVEIGRASCRERV